MGICVCVRMLVCLSECAGMCECKREREKNIVCKWEMGIKTTFLRSELEGLWLEHFFRRLKNRHVDVLESGDRGKRAAGGNLSFSVYYSNHSDSKLNLILLIVSCYRCYNKCNGWRKVTVTVYPTFSTSAKPRPADRRLHQSRSESLPILASKSSNDVTIWRIDLIASSGRTKFVFTILKNLNLHSSTAFELPRLSIVGKQSTVYGT